MKKEIRITLIMICLFVSGLIGGYLINEITVLQEYGSQCVEQCNAYMEHKNMKDIELHNHSFEKFKSCFERMENRYDTITF